MFLKGKGGNWMLKVLAESVIMGAVMAATVGVLIGLRPRESVKPREVRWVLK